MKSFVHCVSNVLKNYPLIILLHNNIRWNLISRQTLFDRAGVVFVPRETMDF